MAAFREMVGSSRLLAVVKADAYGHGVLLAAESFLKGGADSPENFLAYSDFDNTYDTEARFNEGTNEKGKFIPGHKHHKPIRSKRLPRSILCRRGHRNWMSLFCGSPLILWMVRVRCVQLYRKRRR